MRIIACRASTRGPWQVLRQITKTHPTTEPPPDSATIDLFLQRTRAASLPIAPSFNHSIFPLLIVFISPHPTTLFLSTLHLAFHACQSSIPFYYLLIASPFDGPHYHINFSLFDDTTFPFTLISFVLRFCCICVVKILFPSACTTYGYTTTARR